MIELSPIQEQQTDQEQFINFVEYGRMRWIIKRIDKYACVYENDNKLYAALSTGQTISLDKYKGIKDDAVASWLTVLYTIGNERRWNNGCSN